MDKGYIRCHKGGCYLAMAGGVGRWKMDNIESLPLYLRKTPARGLEYV